MSSVSAPRRTTRLTADATADPKAGSSVHEAAAPAPRRALHKGQQTKATIVQPALNLATHLGLEGLSIGALAELPAIRHPPVFAPFPSPPAPPFSSRPP